MKILLAQSEIAQIVQQALVDYVSQKLVISDGTEIQVTMTDDGATIDLITTGETKPQVKKAAPKAETTNVKTFAPKKPVQAPVVAEAVTGPSETDTVPFDVAVEAVKEEDLVRHEAIRESEVVAESTVEPEAAAIEEEAAEVAAPPVRSLFANLRKPVN